MKKAYVMKTFYGDGEPDLRLIRRKDGEIISNRPRACINAGLAICYLNKATEVLVFEISEEDVAAYEDLDYSESQVVKLVRKQVRILNGKIYNFGRKISNNGSFAVCGVIKGSDEIIGIGNTAEEAFADTWYRLGYEERYIGSSEQLDRLSSNYGTTIAHISEEAVKGVEDGDYTLFQSGNLVYHLAYKDTYEVCTEKEYILALMTEYDSNFNEWQEG